MAIFQKLNDLVGIVCLDGDFVINTTIPFGQDVKVYGIGNSSIEATQSGVFRSDYVVVDEFSYDIEINNLTVKNALDLAVQARKAFIQDSTFSGNNAGAVFAASQVTAVNSTFSSNTGGAITVGEANLSEPSVITDSSFINNSRQDPYGIAGGAIVAYGLVISNSTFIGNSVVGEGSSGGAVAGYAVFASNSTFVENSAEGSGAEGGAIWCGYGNVSFSTFVNNEAPTPPELGDTPGNAIYKAGDLFGGFVGAPFDIAGNIFAGTSDYPQLGYGASPTPFTDLGGNVFSTPSDTETDTVQADSSKFGASLSSIFGTSSPALVTVAPNSNGTQTIPINASGPAVDIVPSETYEYISELYSVEFESLGLSAAFDQRGGLRGNPADAGSFEVTSLAKTGTESTFWLIGASVTFIFGGFVAALASRLRRRNS
jgi:hypothetical protein